MNDKDAFRQKTDVSRETLEHLENYAALLTEWNRKINLVSPSTLETLWTRHFLDSAQLFALAPKPNLWADLGSGGGFPGAVIAIMADQAQDTVLVEADQRKATFLRAVARETVGFNVLSKRIEDVEPLGADVVSARALAPLPKLLGYVRPHLAAGGRALLPKGQNAQAEITDALEHWRFDCDTCASETDPSGVILSIGDIKRV